MQKINYSKVLIGGVVAGLIILAFDMASMVVLGFDMEAWAAAHSLAAEPPMAVWVISCLALGILLVWLYAAIRPRFGAGVKTALIAGAFMWLFLTVIYGNLTALGLHTQSDMMKFAAWGVLQIGAAAYAGAWLYKEA